MKNRTLFSLLMLFLVTGCVTQHGVTSELLSQQASAWPLEISDGQLYTDNDTAFLSKLRLIEGARNTIDMSYYIFSDDQSSSFLAKSLLDATHRGVRVRLIVDYETNYQRLDFFSMLEKEGNGNLQVRFYNRPTANIVKDAVFMTMGCTKNQGVAVTTACSAEKFATIDKLFASETIDGITTSGRNISNMNIGNSGLFLSGLYAKRGDVIALAIQKGAGVDLQQVKGEGESTPAQKEDLKNLGKTYWESRTGAPFQRLTANAELFFAFALYGQQLNPLKETVTSVLPIDRKLSDEEIRDWDHFTDYTHQKLLLVDRTGVQMGGRNVENSYHMHPNQLISKYVFMDSDIYATLKSGGDAVALSFNTLWNFTPLLATLSEVRQHAPNDFVVNLKYAEKSCVGSPDKQTHETCMARELEGSSHDLTQRMADAAKTMDENARTYKNSYLPTVVSNLAPGMPLDSGSVLAYLENLPFNKNLPLEKRQRTYGAAAGEEALSGKYIHDIWLKAISGVCASATKTAPKRIILHNAYFFPAANLTYELGTLINGDNDCSNVTVTVLTNSIDTTDLNVVNLAARHSLKAFTEFYQQYGIPSRKAGFEYYEYQKPITGPNLSLHSKVSVFGDDIIIGSANADVRSFMMDSNNAMLVRNAPLFTEKYLTFVNGILADPARVKKLNEYFITTPRESMKQEDIATFRQILTKYGANKKLNEIELQRVETQFIRMLDDAYEMTRDSLNPESSLSQRRKKQNSFNEQFKPI